jgi:hypothetical protein
MKSILSITWKAIIGAFSLLGFLFYIFAIIYISGDTFLGFSFLTLLINRITMSIVVFGFIFFIVLFAFIAKFIQMHNELKKRRY